MRVTYRYHNETFVVDEPDPEPIELFRKDGRLVSRDGTSMPFSVIEGGPSDDESLIAYAESIRLAQKKCVAQEPTPDVKEWAEEDAEVVVQDGEKRSTGLALPRERR